MYMPHKLKLLWWHLFRQSGGERMLKKIYRQFNEKQLKTESPKLFSEKLFTRMILVNRYGHRVFTRLADKYLVREYVKQRVGSKYLVELLWHGVDPRDIPFDKLPPKCVVKTNHGSGGNIVIDGPVDRKAVVERLRKWLKSSCYWTAREYHYYKIPRRVLVEKYLDDGTMDGPLDYRFWCFNGSPEIIQVDNHSHDINPFYNVNWEKLPVSTRKNCKDCEIKEPVNLKEMIRVASELSCGFDFVRVDLYNLSGDIYFGELTFTPVAGQFVFNPESWDATLGLKWDFKHENYRLDDFGVR